MRNLRTSYFFEKPTLPYEKNHLFFIGYRQLVTHTSANRADARSCPLYDMNAV